MESLGTNQRCVAAADVIAACIDEPWCVVATAVIAGDDIETTVRPESHQHDRFEIGSIGKTMTVTALAALVLDGTLALDDEITRWLDAGDNGSITIAELATHTSGLPRLAPNHGAGRTDDEQPYAHFNAADAERGLREAQRRSDDSREYSNFGVQLLGLIVERAAGAPLGDVLRERLWAPLGMTSTSVTGEQNPIVQGYDNRGRPVPAWVGPLPGPGLFTSSVSDMARYAAAVATVQPSPVGSAIQFTINHGLAWSSSDGGWISHNGGTAGASSYLIARPNHGVAAVALANTAGGQDLEQTAQLAALGRDPNEIRPSPASDDDVANVARAAALIENADWPALNAIMVGPTAEQLTPAVIEQAWAPYVADLGVVKGHTIGSVRRQRGGVRAAIRLAFGDGERLVEVWLNDEGEVSGVLLA